MYYQYNNYTISGSFFIAGILQIMPCPLQLLNLPKPSWMNLLLIFWVTKLPQRINLGIGFIIGIITDIILGPILGVRAIISIITIYLLIIKFPFFYNLSLLTKGLIVTLFSFNIHIITYILNIILIKKIKFHAEVLINNILLNSIIDGITWIGIFFVICKIHTYKKIK